VADPVLLEHLDEQVRTRVLAHVTTCRGEGLIVHPVRVVVFR
jgi:hypothetical protein